MPQNKMTGKSISTHDLLAEADASSEVLDMSTGIFQLTTSLRRPTPLQVIIIIVLTFQLTTSLRRPTSTLKIIRQPKDISTHDLLAEADHFILQDCCQYCISTHDLLAEADSKYSQFILIKLTYICYYFTFFSFSLIFECVHHFKMSLYSGANTLDISGHFPFAP